MSEAFKGFTMVLPRACVILMAVFCQLDTYKRHTKVMETRLGQAWVGGSSAFVGYCLIWPFEIIKNLA